MIEFLKDNWETILTFIGALFTGVSFKWLYDNKGWKLDKKKAIVSDTDEVFNKLSERINELHKEFIELSEKFSLAQAEIVAKSIKITQLENEVLRLKQLCDEKSYK